MTLPASFSRWDCRSGTVKSPSDICWVSSNYYTPLTLHEIGYNCTVTYMLQWLMLLSASRVPCAGRYQRVLSNVSGHGLSARLPVQGNPYRPQTAASVRRGTIYTTVPPYIGVQVCLDLLHFAMTISTPRQESKTTQVPL